MDLLEIRKKAKEKKEAEEKAAAQAAEAGQAGGKPSGKAGGKKAGSGGKPSKKALSAKAAKPKPSRSTKLPDEKTAAAAGTADTVIPYEAVPEPPQDVVIEPPPEEPAGALADAAETKPEAVAPEAPPAKEAEDVGGEPGEREDEAGEILPDEDTAVSDENIVEYLAFMLSDEEYAVKVEEVKEIIRLQQITIVPRAEEFVEGIISLRGVIIPVFDIRKRLGLENTGRQKSTRIVIVSEEGSPQGIIVDKVTGVARLDADKIEPPPAVIGGVEAEYLEGVGRIGERLLILFDTNKVLSIGEEAEY